MRQLHNSARSRTLLLALAVLAVAPALAVAAPPPGYCEVKVCNKLERFTLNARTAPSFRAVMDSAATEGRLALRLRYVLHYKLIF
jgi:hypothetical protein